MRFPGSEQVHEWSERQRRADDYYREHILPFGDVRRTPPENWAEWQRLKVEAEEFGNDAQTVPH